MTPELAPRSARPVRLALVAAVVGLVLLAGGALASEKGVSIVQKTFEPSDVTISQGDTVVWTVTEAIEEPHSVTSGASTDPAPGGLFDSKITLKANGDTFKFTFDTAGVFPYYCRVHPTVMTGQVTVLAPGASGPAASGGPGEGPEEPPISVATKLIAAGILGAAIVIMLGWAWLYRRVNR